MRILIALTYYRPHVSGLTIYAERLARGLADRGHDVTVLTSRFDEQLREEENLGGVRIVRVPVLRKLSKGVIMPRFAVRARTEITTHDVVNVHMPQLEASLITELARKGNKPAILTYQCDLRLPPGILNRIVEGCLRPLNRIAARRCDAIVASSDDYAQHSAFLSRHRTKVRAIRPFLALVDEDQSVTRDLLEKWQLGPGPLIGFAARFAAEKGVEVLLNALPAILKEFPTVKIAFTGASQGTIGEETYAKRLAPLIERFRDQLIFLDLLPDAAMPSFYGLCDVIAVTSLNSTEAYGLVQPEAMLCGTPVVASDLPGVREPVRETGMGIVVPPGNPEALAKAVKHILHTPAAYQRERALIKEQFDPQKSLQAYEQLFEECGDGDPEQSCA